MVSQQIQLFQIGVERLKNETDHTESVSKKQAFIDWRKAKKR